MKSKILRRIQDIAQSQQTEELKRVIYDQIEKFVFKYHRRYYPHFKGEIRDLAADIYEMFVRPKKHRDGTVFSELDRVDPDKVGGGEWTGDFNKALATYTQRYTIMRLIDMERSDKREVRVSEDYDEENGGPTVDRIVKRNNPENETEGAYKESKGFSFFELMDNPQAIKNAKKFLVNNPDQVSNIRRLQKHYADKLSPEVNDFINTILGEDEDPNSTGIAAQVESVLGESAKVSKYKLQGLPAVKISFPSKEDMNEAEPLRSEVESILSEDGYKPYKVQGSNWYYINN